MNNVWIVVCDSASARLFQRVGDGVAWQLIETLQHPASRSKSSELVTDGSGRSSPLGASVHHNALAPASTPKEVEKGHFAHTLAKTLDQAMRSHRFHRWVLVAPPQFLGLVRSELTAELTKGLLTSIDKDMTRMTPADLAAKLHDVAQLPLNEREVTRPSTKHPH